MKGRRLAGWETWGKWNHGGWDGLEETPGEYISLLSQPLPTPPYFPPPQEKVIPSVVIQPASNNEEEGEHEGTVDAEYKEATDDTALPGPTSEMPELASEEQKAARASQPAPSAPSASEAFQEVPPGFLYKVLTFILPPFFFLLYSVSGKYNSKICHL